jgi:HEAT repeat protein
MIRYALMITELYDIEKVIGPENTLEGLINSRNKLIQLFVKIGKPAIPILLEALNDTTRYGFVRRSATEAIGKINDPASLSPLHTLLKSGSISQRQGAAEALGNLKSPKSVKPLIKALNDSYWDVRLLSSIALGEIGDASAINPIADRVRDRMKNPNVRAYAALALGKLKATTKIKVILTLLEEENQKSSGGFFAVSYDRALRLITSAKIDAYDGDHIKKQARDRAINQWRDWWEKEGRRKYPQR